MTDTLAKPAFAWAVVDKDGRIWYGSPKMTKADATYVCKTANEHKIGKPPHRVARVKIEEVKETGNDRN